MRNTKFSKITLLVLSLALVIGSIVPFTVSAETTETKPVIIQQNVSYQGDFALMFAVDASTVTAPVKLYRYDTEPGVGQVGTLVSTTSTLTVADAEKNNLKVDSYILKTTGVAASKMTDYAYFKVVDADGDESEVLRYSVAEYLYERLANPASTESQINLYNKVIKFGNAAQIHFGSANPLISTLNLVTVEGGVLSDGYAKGVYATDSTVVPSGYVNGWTVKAYDAEGNVTTSNVNMNTPVVVGGRLELIAGEAKTYRATTQDFENYTAGALPSGFAKGNNANIEVVSDKVYGKTSNVVKTTFTGSGQYARITRTSTNATNATAFEISFDIKIEDTDTTNDYIEIGIYGSSSAKKAYRLNLYSSTAYKIFNYSSSSESHVYAGVDGSQYNHVCFQVRYTNEEKTNYALYVSVNDSEPFCIDTELDGTTATDVFKFSIVDFIARSNYAGLTVSIDNLFCGYITD